MTDRRVTAAWQILDDEGRCLEQSAPHKPMRYMEGDDTLLPALAEALAGVQAGEERTVRLEPAQAYGPYLEHLVFDVVNANLPMGCRPRPGMTLTPGGQQGRFQLKILEVFDDHVRVDGNHRYAGQPLTFRVQVLAVA